MGASTRPYRITSGARRARSTTEAAGPTEAGLSQHRRARLSALEVAEAAALADVAAAICVISRVLPLTAAATLVSSLPFAVLAMRRRFSVCLLGGAVGSMVALLFGGHTPASMVAGAAVMGLFAGVALKRQWSLPTIALVALGAVAAPAAGIATAIVAIFSNYREFLFDNVRNGIGGITRLAVASGLTTAEGLRHAIDTALEHWPIAIPVATAVTGLIALAITLLFVWRPAPSIVRRLGSPSIDSVSRESGVIAPVPAHLRGVGVTHPGQTRPAVTGVNLDVAPGKLLALAGHNGAGKSTLARVISGRVPTVGTVTRPGRAGLGMVGGTAMIGQRPETSVLGLQVGDDLGWGQGDMSPAHARRLLDRVGLEVGLDTETARLSGGQLQRLAVASALARDPHLLVSDEATAMLDADGRARLMATYRALSADGTAIVYVTHDDSEISSADAIIRLPGGEPEAIPDTPRGRPIRGGRLELRNVVFAHDYATPWHRDVLADVSLSVAPGQTVLITGPNGAGKSTLARLIAGIDIPESGEILLDGDAVVNGRGDALYGHQFARLSLVRSRVYDDICDAAGADRSDGRLVWGALRELGLDPHRYAQARIDELSVGQQRRVALAGLLAARPRLLVLDEPLAGLDEQSRSAMVAALARVRALGTTVVIVTHDETELLPIADRAIEVEPLRDSFHRQLSRRHRGSPSRASVVGVVGRVLPYPSLAKRLWVGTKVFAIVAIAVMFAVQPTWPSVGVAAAIAVLWTAAGRIRASALPRLPMWIVIVTLAGGAITALGGGKPFVTIADVRFGLGGVSTFGVLIAITIVSFYLSLLFCWTTPMAEVPAFGQRVVRWFSHVRIDVQAIAVGVTVSLRLLPFMISDLSALMQTVNQRRAPGADTATRRAERISACLPIACSLAVVSAREVAASMENRGGIGVVSRADRRPGFGDVLVILALVAAVGAAVALGYPGY